MDKVYEISLLLDFYGQMLTSRQKVILEMHYNDDLSFGEIAENLDISRQGVYDNIKRGKAVLTELENKLGLVRKFSLQRKKSMELLEVIKDFDYRGLDEKNKEILRRIENGINEIMNII